MSSSFPGSPPLVLAFSATDPTGGAGLQADVLAIAASGCHPLSVLTGYTVQDTHGVHSLRPLEASAVREQARALLAELSVSAVKLGVLGSIANAQAIAGLLPDVPVVLDPVLASGRGDPLASAETIRVLLPRATIATPNTTEARALGGVASMLAAGCRYVLVTGTHEPGDDVVNVLYDSSGIVREDHWPRLPGSYHGSGCTLAAALAAALARGRDVPAAAREAQHYAWNALKNGFRPGAGQHLPRR